MIRRFVPKVPVSVGKNLLTAPVFADPAKTRAARLANTILFLILAIVVAVGVYIFTNRTTGGYELTATGANARASRVYGINVKRMFVLSLVIGGALAGLSGAIEVAGVQHRLISGLQANFLILGLIIGLISRGNNLAVPFVAFFIAVLEVGASAMQRTMTIPIEMAMIVEALVLLFVLLSDVVSRRKAR